MTERRPLGPDIRGWVGEPPAAPVPSTRWHRDRARHYMPLVVAQLAAFGYTPDELEDLDLQDALTLTLRAAEQYQAWPHREVDMQGIADHLALAAVALQAAYRLQDALPYLSNTQIVLALTDFTDARDLLDRSVPPGRPAGTRQEASA